VDQLKDLFRQNKVAATASHHTTFLYGVLENLQKEELPEADLKTIMLKGDGGVNKMQARTPFHSLSLITAGCKNPEAVLRYYDYYAETDGLHELMYGIEGKSWRKIEDKPGKMELLKSDGSVAATWNESDTYYIYYYYAPEIWVEGKSIRLWGDQWTGDYTASSLEEMASFPHHYAVDDLVNYDQSKWESQPKLNDMETFIEEAKLKIIMGDEPLDSWSEMLNEWYKMGGNLMIEDQTRQYNESK
jgi:putative aldouronate transport system substrate-binding protein